MSDALRPFVITTAPGAVEELRRRLRLTRWPEREPVDDWSQGVPLTYLREVCDYWAEAYDWSATVARLNAIPQFISTIDGIDVHFQHVRSDRDDAVPVIMTHGWPGSFLEFEATIPALVNPGVEKEPAFDVVVPSLPGYGFSARPSTTGWGIERIADAWAELMARLGYDRFLAVGSDWGTSVATALALRHPHRLLGVHLVPPLVAPDPDPNSWTEAEREGQRILTERARSGSGYSAIQATRPQTIGYALDDSPAGLCAWIVEKIWAWADHDGDLDTVLGRDQVLDDVTLYWLTATAASSARLYWESIRTVSGWFTDGAGDTIAVPAGCSVFPAEAPRPSRRWAQRRFTNIVHWGEPARGGHFAAWEQPELFVAEVRAVAGAVGHGPRDLAGLHTL
jgi:pimeloyl-ACP methyl ester carboxylesterase